MATLLGKELKPVTSNWQLMIGSAEALTPEAIEQVATISVHSSSLQSNSWYAKITLHTGEYVTFTLDVRCLDQLDLEEGLLLDPRSVIVNKYTNGEKVISRLYGHAL